MMPSMTMTVTLASLAATLAASVPHVRDAERRVLRVASFNVDHAFDLEGLVRAITADANLASVDLLLVQEIEVRGEVDGPRELARGLGLDLFYAAARPIRDGSHGLAILSRDRLLEREVVELPRNDLGYRSRPRVALSALVRTGEKDLRVVNVHLDTRITLSARIAQLEPALERLRGERRAILGGDLNTIRALPGLLPWLPLPLPGLGQAVGLDRFMLERGFDAPHAAVGGTGALGMRLDGVYTRGFEVMGAGKTRFAGLSDHAAVWVDVGLGDEDLKP